MTTDVEARCVSCGGPFEDGERTIPHKPGCNDKPMEQSELKRVFRNRVATPRKTETTDPDTGRYVWDAYQVAPEEHLTVVMAGEARDPVVRLLGELAALSHMADANRSVPTDRGRRGHGDAIPSFDPAAAQRELTKAADRLYQEAEKLAGVTRNPHQSPEALCEFCRRRPRLVDTLCGPCGARVLKEHRRSG